MEPTPHGIDWQRAFFIPLTILAWLAVLVIVGWILGHVATTVITLVLSTVIAFALTPVVELLARWMPRSLAVAVAYLAGFAFVFGVGALLILTAASQVTQLVHDLPHYVDALHDIQPRILRLLRPFGVTQAQLQHAEQQVLEALQRTGTRLASESVAIVARIFETIVDLILVLILSVYLTANGPKIAARLRARAPEGGRSRVVSIIDIVNRVVGGYVRGTIAMASFIGVLVGAGMAVLRVPYAVLLGLLAFFMEFVPVVGVFISGAVCVLVALSVDWRLALIVLGYFVLVHVIEGDLVGPRVMGRAVGIHPATAVLALVAGIELFGIWGALFASPLAGLVQALGTQIWDEFRQSADASGTHLDVPDHRPPPDEGPQDRSGSPRSPGAEGPPMGEREHSAHGLHLPGRRR